MSKILFVGPVLGNLVGFRGELIKRLVADGDDVTLVSKDSTPDNPLLPVGTKGICVEVDRRGSNAFKDIGQILAYRRILKKVKPDVALLFTTKCSVYAGLACRMSKIPYIVNNSGLIDMSSLSSPIKMVLQNLYIIGYCGASCMMYQNSYERDYFNKLIKKKIHYVDIPGSGVNLSVYKLHNYPTAESPVVFNYVARIAQFKGIDEYIECAKIIHKKHPATVFRIYGNYDESNYKGIIKKLDAEGIVKYMGRKSDMKPEIESCHAVIHPSHYEGLTNVILEHSAMGRVCIASNIPGCREAIDDRKTGFLFQKCDVKELVDVVEQFIMMPLEMKANMGQLAHDKIAKEFDRQIVTDAYVREINNIINK